MWSIWLISGCETVFAPLSSFYPMIFRLVHKIHLGPWDSLWSDRLVLVCEMYFCPLDSLVRYFWVCEAHFNLFGSSQWTACPVNTVCSIGKPVKTLIWSCLWEKCLVYNLWPSEFLLSSVGWLRWNLRYWVKSWVYWKFKIIEASLALVGFPLWNVKTVFQGGLRLISRI